MYMYAIVKNYESYKWSIKVAFKFGHQGRTSWSAPEREGRLEQQPNFLHKRCVLQTPNGR